MAKPTVTYTWATNATVTDAGNPAFGLNTKSAPSAGRQASGLGASEVIPGDEYNYLKNADGQWINFLDGSIDANDQWNFESGVKTVTDLPIGAHHGSWGNNNPGSAAGLPGWIAQSYNRMESNYAQASLFIDFTRWVPDGATLTGVKAMVKPGVGEGTAGNRMQLRVRVVDHSGFGSGSPPTETLLGTDANDDGTTNEQTMTIGVISEAIDKTNGKTYVARIEAENNTTADECYGILISFTYPGPRAL